MDEEDCKVASILPAYLRKALPFQCLNRMQSKCLEAWREESNLLICAPTGSGKTVCFELAMLRHLYKHFEATGATHLGSCGLNGKMVFIAPTKALCNERADDWKTRYAFLGLRVDILNGDTWGSASYSRLATADLILTTAEKWESVTRNVDTQGIENLTGQVALLLLDEIHLIGDSRGAAFEAVVTRMLASSNDHRHGIAFSSKPPVADLRVIAVSATVANPEDVAVWLRVQPQCVKKFDSTYRPVPLTFRTISYYVRNPWESGKTYDYHILRLIRNFSSEKPALVFCPSRRQSTLSAQALVEQLDQQNPVDTNLLHDGSKRNILTINLSREEHQKLDSAAKECNDKILAQLLPSGIAIHNAEMSPSSRRLVEQLFRESLIRCLFATSTLAQGVNLPARLVVIAGTAVYCTGALHEYQRNTLMQMCGRAGRPGLDTEGIAVIMTTKQNARLYENLAADPPDVVDSRLGLKLKETMNTEIARQFVTDIPAAVSFISSTYYWTREKKLRPAVENSSKCLRSIITSISMSTVQELSDLELIHFDDDGFSLSSTPSGVATARYCISVETIRQLVKETAKITSPAQAFKVIGSTTEVVADVCLRRSEKRRLNEVNEFVRLPIRGKVKTRTDKVIILLQMILGQHFRTTRLDLSLQNEAGRVMESASRISSCLTSLLLDLYIPAPYEAIFAVLQVCRGLLSRTYWDGPTVLTQLPGIGLSEARVLVKYGVCNFTELSKLNAVDIDSYTDVRNTIGKKVLTGLCEVPKFQLQIAARRDASRGGMITGVKIHSTFSAQVGHRLPRRCRKRRGFLMVGSHSVGMMHITTFSLDMAYREFDVAIDLNPSTYAERWIDVCVGCDSIIGIDASERLMIQDAYHSKPDFSNRAEGKTIRAPDLNRAMPTFSVAGGRVSKRLVQSDIVQALTRGYTRGLKKNRVDLLRQKHGTNSTSEPTDLSPPCEESRNEHVEKTRTPLSTGPERGARATGKRHSAHPLPPHFPSGQGPATYNLQTKADISDSVTTYVPSSATMRKEMKKEHSSTQGFLTYVDNSLRTCATQTAQPGSAKISSNSDFSGREYDDLFRSLF